MEREESGSLLQYRCHIGHVLAAETMLAAQFTVLEAKLASGLVALKERAELCRQIAETGQGNTADLQAAEKEALQRAKELKAMLESEWRFALRPEQGEGG
jgi:two-component system chemotaxis response regulator CheB